MSGRALSDIHPQATNASIYDDGAAWRDRDMDARASAYLEGGDRYAGCAFAEHGESHVCVSPHEWLRPHACVKSEIRKAAHTTAIRKLPGRTTRLDDAALLRNEMFRAARPATRSARGCQPRVVSSPASIKTNHPSPQFPLLVIIRITTYSRRTSAVHNALSRHREPCHVFSATPLRYSRIDQ